MLQTSESRKREEEKREVEMKGHRVEAGGAVGGCWERPEVAGSGRMSVGAGMMGA
ncbi:hypothetical protein IGS67_02605 [Flavimobilis sp. GY10621]|uniref:Uncharacterized protein n=1 Tax=Flavimobilis rhizosphaerae TaxID=2775421 RepID=A0ABR9DMN4_9MICO|nr:hypothetical protein [Flavimobilis rhizosphaerae]MBD9698385.1 hypothetical protein [Flavimobilis rhizosphaerae]